MIHDSSDQAVGGRGPQAWPYRTSGRGPLSRQQGKTILIDRFCVVPYPQGADPHPPFPLREGRQVREINPLLPSGISERFS